MIHFFVGFFYLIPFWAWDSGGVEEISNLAHVQRVAIIGGKGQVSQGLILCAMLSNE